MKRTLTLRRETLTSLDTEELAMIAGGDHTVPGCQVEMAKLIVKLLLSPFPTDTCV